MTFPSIRSELAAAIRAVNAGYNRLPGDAQDTISIAYDALEAEVEAAAANEDRERALAAIRAWRGHWLDRFKRAAR